MTALECFTVIEESAGNMGISKKRDLMEFFDRNIKGLSVEKTALIQALIVALS
jgi:hypothetical protein